LSILAALIAINVGVIWYHGDPRDSIQQEKRTTEKVEAETKKAAVSSESEPKTVEQESPAELDGPPIGLARFVDPSAVPGLTTELDPLAGLRSPARVQRVEVLELERGQTVAAALVAGGAAGEDVQSALSSLTDLVDFRSMRPGNVLKARFDGGERLVSVDIHSSLLDRARAERTAGIWSATKLDVEVDETVAQISGTVHSSLWEALISAGERPRLVSQIVEIFGWDIDFYRDVYPGDSFRLLVDKRYVDGDFIGYGPVYAAEFISAGNVHRAFRFERADGGIAFYDQEGRSMRKQLLKSPLEYGRMTSGYGNRKHPILGYNRAHNGVDYGVPTGTPVWTVGDGTVIRSNYSKGFGKIVEIRHANNWISQYAHLSKRLVKVGQRVSQKEIIGKVGSTGLSTGPHLHYGLKKNGKYVNPAAQKFERGKALTGGDLDRYLRDVERLREKLSQIRIAERPDGASDREG
jgi:murein DD-endopeptidase MepM/ murein hydrolase activator NlpD